MIQRLQNADFTERSDRKLMKGTLEANITKFRVKCEEKNREIEFTPCVSVSSLIFLSATTFEGSSLAWALWTSLKKQY